MAEREKQRQEEFWNRRRMAEPLLEPMDEEERMYWEERRRFDEECGMGGMPPSSDLSWRNFPIRNRPLMGFSMFNMMNGRRLESLDDRHVIARHAEIYPKEDELQGIQKIVSHTERALKLVSDAMTETTKVITTDSAVQVQPSSSSSEPAAAAVSDSEVKTEGSSGSDNNKNGGENKENGSQMISFQKDTEGTTVRLLKGVMRVGLLAKGSFN